MQDKPLIARPPIGVRASRRGIIAAAAGAVAATTPTQAQNTPPGVRIFNPPGMPKPVGFSQIAEVTAGRTVYIAGQIGIDPSGKQVGGPGDFRAQATQAFENLKVALAAAGGGFENLVKLSVYFTDLAAHAQTFRDVRDSYVNKDAPPPSTFVQVARLARDWVLLEVEATAVVPART